MGVEAGEDHGHAINQISMNNDGHSHSFHVLEEDVLRFVVKCMRGFTRGPYLSCKF